ncbi:DNA-processing protein DprA [Isoalcanivorax indicus]|uniref:DNA-processing protein DprA n=1 Tax=Isoalcanivorax indicus TaxID=2202653 RepID=UPI000DB97111|nr:DNA-processing protein DprA [Isoalcanivorax indicus]
MDGFTRRLALSLAFDTAAPRLGPLLNAHRDDPVSDAGDGLPVSLLDDAGLPDPQRLNPWLPPALRQRRPVATARLHGWADQLRADGWQLLALTDAHYPALLAALPDAPGLLFVRGDSALLHAPQLAMVGARNASPEGLGHAHRFAAALAEKGFVISSGLALGIDAAAHEGALSRGHTLAVMGGGPDRIYPPRHAALAARIVEQGGALVTEYPPGMAPRKEHFPLRNRIISGLSLGVIVVEAALRSGSLITARLAAEQGRAVFAIPGALNNPLSRGCHRLLRDGAHWLESLDDVLAHFSDFTALAGSLNPQDGGAQTSLPLAPASGLLAHLHSGVNTLDDLARRTGQSVAELAAELARLEFSGQVRRVPGGYARC